MSETAVAEIPNISIEYRHPYLIIKDIMDSYEAELRPLLTLGQMPFVSIDQFRENIEKMGYACEELGPEVFAARKMILSHLERAVKGTPRTKGLPRISYGQHLVRAIDDQFNLFRAALERDEVYLQLVSEEQGSDAAS